MDLFDGFDTITEKEIEAGNLAAAKNNYMKLTEAITAENAVDVAKAILFSLDPRLRAQDCYMFCSQDFADKYNEAFQITHGGLVYNGQYNQDTIEGSNGKLHIVPLFNKMGSKFIHICPKVNMLVGYDQMSDSESVMVKEFEPFILSYIATSSSPSTSAASKLSSCRMMIRLHRRKRKANQRLCLRDGYELIAVAIPAELLLFNLKTTQYA